MPAGEIRASSTFPAWLAIAFVPPALGMLFGPRLIILGFGLTAAMIIIVALVGDRRMRSSVFHCDALPIEIGTKLTGRVEAQLSGVPDDGVLLVLRCERRRGSRDHHRIEVLWRDEVVARPSDIRSEQSRSIIPVAFEMPTSGLPSGSPPGFSRTGPVTWSLDATAPGYFARFMLPAIRASGPVTVTPEQLRPFATVRESLHDDQ